MTLPDFLTREDDGFVRLTDHRIGLHHLVRLHRDGYSPEMLAEHYPTLPLSLVERVIAFYLEHQAEVDAQVAVEDEDFERQEATTRGPSVEELRRRSDTRRQARAS